MNPTLHGTRLFHPSAARHTILGVWAHPDDESFLSGAFMAQAVNAGHRVVVATATRGEGGTPDPEEFPPDVLARIRENELANSLEQIGVGEHVWLDDDLRDGSLDQVPLNVGARLVGDVIDHVQPDLVVTFGPDGLTGHTDHQAVSRWVTAASDARGRNHDVWHTALTHSFLDRWGDLCDEQGVWMSEAPPRPHDETALVHVQRSDNNVAGRKFAALRAHSSQTARLIERVGSNTFEKWWGDEFFAAAL